MPLEFKPFYGNHVRYIDPQDNQKAEWAAFLQPEYLAAAEDGLALSAWDGNRCVAAAGIVHLYPHRAIAWALLSRYAGGYMGGIVRKVRTVMSLDPTARIEMTVKADFEPGIRFAKAIGMTQETGVLRKHGMNGDDEYIDNG